MNIIVITGASSGIGMEFAMQMDSYFGNIDEFWLVARSYERLKEVAKALGHRTRLFPMDITCKERLDLLEDAVVKHNAAVRMLINCAGYGMMGDGALYEAGKPHHSDGFQRRIPAPAGFRRVCRHKVLCTELFQSAGRRAAGGRDLCHLCLSGARGHALF